MDCIIQHLVFTNRKSGFVKRHPVLHSVVEAVRMCQLVSTGWN